MASGHSTSETPAGVGRILRVDPALDALVPTSATIDKILDGCIFTEGPIWRPDGSLWFSDVVGNVVRRWHPTEGVKELFRPGGYDGSSLPPGFIGPNGMTAGPDRTVILCQHGNRRVVSIGADMKMTTVVDAYEGKRLNSPNDVVFKSDGGMYFTDPPYGLPKQDTDPNKDLPFNGVYRYANGKLTLLVDDLTRPNGLAFSPDEKTLYVANSDDAKRIWMAYDVLADGTVRNGRVFADLTAHPDPGLPDGFKMDVHGNMYTTGPGGVWVFSPSGAHLGTIKLPEQPANVGWIDDWHTLVMTAETSVYRIRLAAAGQPLVYSW
jgi:gluconolactonase